MKATRNPGRRRPALRRYPRGEETRQRIVEAALEVFGGRGYEAASTRLIAEQAGVTLPALQYYFAGKQGLYMACAEYIKEHMKSLTNPALTSIESAVSADVKIGNAELRKMLVAVLDDCCDLLVGSTDAEHWALFIIREQASPTAAFAVIYDGILNRIIGACSELIAKLLGRRQDQDTRLRALGLLGQVLLFRTARETALRTLSWKKIGSPQLAQIKHALHLQIDRTLMEPKVQGR
jgi:TetR/AcrR family transcriptional regulator, regulator of cefoperazone and chloramphenicol sensitivity